MTGDCTYTVIELNRVTRKKRHGRGSPATGSEGKHANTAGEGTGEKAKKKSTFKFWGGTRSAKDLTIGGTVRELCDRSIVTSAITAKRKNEMIDTCMDNSGTRPVNNIPSIAAANAWKAKR
jgi:hypothetical protein